MVADSHLPDYITSTKGKDSKSEERISYTITMLGPYTVVMSLCNSTALLLHRTALLRNRPHGTSKKIP